MAKQHAPAGAKESWPQGTLTVTDLAQVRALADPLRLRILGALARMPRTTKQVADLLGEKPTKLYHHVEALERVGLIRLTETRPNRGTVEKYYRAVAAQFQVAASALSPDPGAGGELGAEEAMLTTILDAARKELVAYLRCNPAAPTDSAEAPFVARITLNVSSKKLQAVRRRLLQWVEKLRAAEAEAERTGKEGGRDKVTWTCTVAFCRTDSL
jgi:DNA-binding transcriptional ArsR family regulator